MLVQLLALLGWENLGKSRFPAGFLPVSAGEVSTGGGLSAGGSAGGVSVTTGGSSVVGTGVTSSVGQVVVSLVTTTSTTVVVDSSQPSVQLVTVAKAVEVVMVDGSSWAWEAATKAKMLRMAAFFMLNLLLSSTRSGE